MGPGRDSVIPKCCNKTLMAKPRFGEFNFLLMNWLGLATFYILMESKAVTSSDDSDNRAAMKICAWG